MSNDKLYRITKQEKWSRKIKQRRIRLFGHILRLHEDTPARKALNEITKPRQKLQGGQQTTWITNIMKDLEETLKHHNIGRSFNTEALKKLLVIAEDREVWYRELKRSMGHQS